MENLSTKRDLQTASLLKRFSAFLLDAIAISILATLLAWVVSALTGYDSYNDRVKDAWARYETEYGVTFDITEEEFNAFSPERREVWNRAYEALVSDRDAMAAWNMAMNLTVVIVSISLFLSYLIWEFAIPLFLGHGRTVGKKIFGLALVRTSGVKVNHISLFIRTVLGKYAIETMVPAYIIILMLFSAIGVTGPLVLVALLLLEILLVVFRYGHQSIHCLISDTVVCDWASQKIWNTEEEMLEAMKEEAKRKSERAGYY